MMKTILHITPSMPPEINGLGDFCYILSRNLEREGYTDQAFLVRKHPALNTIKNIYAFAPGNFEKALDAFRPEVVLLHYVGYGYSAQGTPWYLVRGLRNYKRKSGCRMLVFFHELYADSNSIFKLPFYTHRLQKAIVKQLYALADSTFTNCDSYTQLLKRIGDKTSDKTICTGIFSNVPDNLFDDGLAKDPQSMVVFGSLARRKLVYNHSWFVSLLQDLEVKRLYDIGPGDVAFTAPGIAWNKMGPLAAVELAGCLNSVNFGCLCYKPHLLGKSGILSAYAAFGVIPINLNYSGDSPGDGLVEGRNYFSRATGIRPNNIMEDDARRQLRIWYNSHNQYAVSEKIRLCL